MEFDIVSVDWMAKLDGMCLMVNTKGVDASKVCGMVDPNKEYVFAIKEKTKKRSLDANRYFWQLCGKIAERLSLEGVHYTKEEIYKDAIRESGIWKDDIVPNDKVEWRCASWELIGIGWFTEHIDFTPDGENSLIRFYYGSSRYNVRQMHRITEKIVQDCRNMGIETLPPERLNSLLGEWK